MKKLILSVSFVLLPILIFAQFSLPKLNYSYNALEPFIDSVTMRIHYNNHHAAYVKNLNTAIAKYPELKSKTVEDLMYGLDNLPSDIKTAVRNNGGGHYNHTLFWSLLAPAGTTKMTPKVEKALIKAFGSVEEFKKEFEKAATGRFGSGWAWLIQDKSGKLLIVSTPNQDNPLMSNAEVKGTPILALDVWEHAYYLKYQSGRASYAQAFWNIVNWTKVDQLLK